MDTMLPNLTFLNVLGLVAIVASLFGSGRLVKMIVGNFATPENHPLVHQLKHPRWSPSMTSIRNKFRMLYLSQGPAIWLILIDPRTTTTTPQIWWFAFQFILYLIWPVLFFRFKLLGWAVIDAVFLWFVIDITIYKFWEMNPLASWFLYPYLCWITSACALSFHLWKLNKGKGKSNTDPLSSISVDTGERDRTL